MKNTFKKKSLNRILQEVYSMEKTVDGSIIEFGAEAGSSKNFTNFVKLKDVKKLYIVINFQKTMKLLKRI